MSQNPFWAIFHVVEIWLADRYGALISDWLNSQMVKTSLGEIPMSQNLFRAIFHVPEIWLVDRYGALKPDWLNFPILKTPLGQIPMSQTSSEPFSTFLKSDWLIAMEPWNLIGWIPRVLKPHWVNFPYSITYGPTKLRMLYILVIAFTKIRCSFDPKANIQTNNLFFFIWPSLQSREYSFFCEKISMSTTRISCCTIDLNVFYSNHLAELELHQCDTLVSYLPSIVWKK